MENNWQFETLMVSYAFVYLTSFAISLSKFDIKRLKSEYLTGRLVKDAPLTIQRTFIELCSLFFILESTALGVVYFLISMEVSNALLLFFITAAPVGLFGYFTIHFVNRYRAYNFGVYIDSKLSIIDFVASDIGDTVHDILTGKQFLDHGNRRTIPLNDIESIDNYSDRRGKNISYYLTLSGSFGSSQLEFSCKQKRDECRNAIAVESKKLGFMSPLKTDTNFDY